MGPPRIISRASAPILGREARQGCSSAISQPNQALAFNASAKRLQDELIRIGHVVIFRMSDYGKKRAQGQVSEPETLCSAQASSLIFGGTLGIYLPELRSKASGTRCGMLEEGHLAGCRHLFSAKLCREPWLPACAPREFRKDQCLRSATGEPAASAANAQQVSMSETLRSPGNAEVMAACLIDPHSRSTQENTLWRHSEMSQLPFV